jgi:hypothetical protein
MNRKTLAAAGLTLAIGGTLALTACSGSTSTYARSTVSTAPATRAEAPTPAHNYNPTAVLEANGYTPNSTITQAFNQGAGDMESEYFTGTAGGLNTEGDAEIVVTLTTTTLTSGLTPSEVQSSLTGYPGATVTADGPDMIIYIPATDL